MLKILQEMWKTIPHDYNDDDENRSNDDDIDDFDEDNDSKSEVNHRKKVNDEPQKETWKRKALDTAEEGSPEKKVCSEFIYIPTNSSLAWQKVEWKWSHLFDKLTELECLKSFCYFLDIFLQRLKHMDMDWVFTSRKTLKITRNSKDLLLRILWNTFLSNLIKIEQGKRVSL